MKLTARFFLPSTPRSHSLSYLHHLSVPRHIDWKLARRVRGITVGRLGDPSFPPYFEEILGLFLGYTQNGYPAGETLSAMGFLSFLGVGKEHRADWGKAVTFIISLL